ncbi:tigger transposable element-derived protein 4-like [Bactrocera neohumeralis]|uniref:tigger transposable element-derived protein 4-like n=1 Tax=Bactrocera neohumeralis TaxID=98809 RepID=UPI0021661B61|nr:tigger transposable element-derived protein 4-like [Bactrocera neohumeralis]
MSALKRKCFSIEEKATIIHRLEAGESNALLAKEFGVSHSTISTIKKNKSKIEPLFNENVLKIKRVRVSSQDDVDKALLQWFKVQRNEGIPINGPILQEKANEFAKKFNISGFECSTSWISRFKVRHNIVAGKVAGESLSVQKSDVSDWLAKVWPNLKAQFSDDEIFNADEAGLFYKLTPNQTLKFRGEKCLGGKLSKERLTVLIAANMSGTIKRKLLVIGKSKRPRCFKNVRSLPVDYVSNSRAWMTSDIFTKWVRDWDRELKKTKKKILLLVDNCPAHPKIDDLRSITLVFLPPNTTSILQPMDQGVIRAFKSYFRKFLVLKLINVHDNIKNNKVGQVNITILDSILMMYDAWNKVSEITISNCFKHAGFSIANIGVTSTSISSDFDDEDDVPLSVWASAFESSLPISTEEIEEFSSIDNNLAICGELTDEEIVQNVIVDKSDSDDSADENDQISSSPSVSEALKSAEILNQFVHANFVDESAKNMMSILHNAVRDSYFHHNKKKQSTLKITLMLKELRD